MKYVNLTLIILFILIDIFLITNLWGEDFYRRFLHHLQHNQYNPNKKPWIVFPEVSLYQDEINRLLEISEQTKNKCLNNISKVWFYCFGRKLFKKVFFIF